MKDPFREGRTMQTTLIDQNPQLDQWQFTSFEHILRSNFVQSEEEPLLWTKVMSTQCISMLFTALTVLSWPFSNLKHPADLSSHRQWGHWGPSSGVKIPMTSCHWKTGGSWSIREVVDFQAGEGGKSINIINMSSNVFECLWSFLTYLLYLLYLLCLLLLPLQKTPDIHILLEY